MRTRCNTQWESIPIPTPTPTPMEIGEERIANHCLEATPKGAPQAHDYIHKIIRRTTKYDHSAGIPPFLPDSS
jgi:hypothetical protein